MRSMLTIDNREWHAKLRAAGMVEGKAEALILFLAEKFGAVAPYRQKRIRGARLATLDRWLKRAVVARNLPSVFSARRSGGSSGVSRRRGG
jgi:hypothetical protein